MKKTPTKILMMVSILSFPVAMPGFGTAEAATFGPPVSVAEMCAFGGGELDSEGNCHFPPPPSVAEMCANSGGEIDQEGNCNFKAPGGLNDEGNGLFGNRGDSAPEFQLPNMLGL